MAENEEISEAEGNPSEQSELQEPSQQESLSQQTSQPQQSTSEQSSNRSPVSTSQQDTPRLLSEQCSPSFNPALLTVEEQIAYLTHKYSRMDVPYCYADAIPRRPASPQKPQSPRQVLNHVPSLGTSENNISHFKHPHPRPAVNGNCIPQSLPSPRQLYLPPTWQAVQQYSLKMPPESRIDDFSQEKVQGWLSILRKHEKEQYEENKKEQEKNKQELEEKNKKEQQEKTKQEQEENTKIKEEEEENTDVDSTDDPDI